MKKLFSVIWKIFIVVCLVAIIILIIQKPKTDESTEKNTYGEISRIIEEHEAERENTGQKSGVEEASVTKESDGNYNSRATEEKKEEYLSETAEKTYDGKVSPEFKEMMDSYEAFFDEYVEFMKKYEQSDDISGMLIDYADYMKKYADYMEKLEAVDADELSVAETAYYIEVQARITEKLAEIID